MSAQEKFQKDVMVVLFRLVAFMAKHNLRLYEKMVKNNFINADFMLEARTTLA
jgi:NADH:ubiquinone oxidoreductase subunit B-like Fe-S oxidoreductase